MDTNQLIGVIAMALSALLLVVISAAEAGVIALSRSHVRSREPNGAAALLRRTLDRRQAMLGALSAAATTVTVVGTAAAALVFASTREMSIALAALVALSSLVIITLLRHTARTVALVSPESTAIRLAWPVRWLHATFRPVAWTAAAPARLALRLFGQTTRPDEVDAADELLAVLEVPDAHNGIDEAPLAEERRMMRGILAMSDQTVRELMTPRLDITGVPVDASIGDVLRVIEESGYSRIPLFDETIDSIVGIVYAKDLLAHLRTGDTQPDLRQIARPPYFLPEMKRANELLAEMRRNQAHLGVAVDEYGGTAGIITAEDLLEEIVGDIADEYDSSEVEVERIAEDEAIVDARLPVDDLNELFAISVESDDFDTVGGLVFSLLGRLAKPGDTVESRDQGLQLEVLSVLGHRIKKVRVRRRAETEDSSAVAV